MADLSQPPTHPGAELILNPDGSLYHLHLLPADLAETIILVGDPDRVEKVSRHFDAIAVRKQHREFVTHTGNIGKNRITVLSTGIGTDNIDIVLNELDALANIHLETGTERPGRKSLRLIRIGTSGALQADIDPGTVLVSSHAIGLDGLLNHYQSNGVRLSEAEKSVAGQLNLDYVKPYVVEAGKDLMKAFQGFKTGITVTCSGFYGPQGRRIRAAIAEPELIRKIAALKLNEGQVTNFEMETAGIYGLAALLGHQALSVNAILANRITNRFASEPERITENCIADVLRNLF